MISNMQTFLLQQVYFSLFSSLAFNTSVIIIGVAFVSYAPYLRCMFKRFIRIQIHKLLVARHLKRGDNDIFVTYYRNSLCNLQQVNNDLLRKILKKNQSCSFLVNQSNSRLSSYSVSSLSNEDGHSFIDEFREKFPLTTYDDYRSYVDRMIKNGEKNLLCSDKIIYYAASSGTTGKTKHLPVTRSMLKQLMSIINLGSVAIQRSFPVSFSPVPQQRFFSLQTGKKANMFLRSKDSTPIGPLSQLMSVVSLFPGFRFIASALSIIDSKLIEGISDYETSTFVQLVFALTVADISAYSVPFASGCLHTIKMIENHFE